MLFKAIGSEAVLSFEEQPFPSFCGGRVIVRPWIVPINGKSIIEYKTGKKLSCVGRKHKLEILEWWWEQIQHTISEFTSYLESGCSLQSYNNSKTCGFFDKYYDENGGMEERKVTGDNFRNRAFIFMSDAMINEGLNIFKMSCFSIAMADSRWKSITPEGNINMNTERMTNVWYLPVKHDDMFGEHSVGEEEHFDGTVETLLHYGTI